MGFNNLQPASGPFFLAPGGVARIVVWFGNPGDDHGAQWIMAHPLDEKVPASLTVSDFTMEESVRRYYDVWKQVYPHRDDGDLISNAKVQNQLRDLALKMKDDLAGIVDFLQSIGVQLDDHYMIYRDVIRRYSGEA